jgi:hypothetical protein
MAKTLRRGTRVETPRKSLDMFWLDLVWRIFHPDAIDM